MDDIDEVRRYAMKKLEDEVGGPVAAAARVGMSYSQWANLRAGAHDSKTGKKRGMRKETARKIEAAFGKPAGWLDATDTALMLVDTEGADGLITTWRNASPEAREVARFALSEPGTPLPPWADSTMRKDINNMLYAASHWLRGGEKKVLSVA